MARLLNLKSYLKLKINSKELIKQLSLKHDIPEKTIEDIITSPFKKVRAVIKEGEDNIRLMHLGSFVRKDSINRKKKLK